VGKKENTRVTIENAESVNEVDMLSNKLVKNLNISNVRVSGGEFEEISKMFQGIKSIKSDNCYIEKDNHLASFKKLSGCHVSHSTLEDIDFIDGVDGIKIDNPLTGKSEKNYFYLNIRDTEVLNFANKKISYNGNHMSFKETNIDYGNLFFYLDAPNLNKLEVERETLDEDFFRWIGGYKKLEEIDIPFVEILTDRYFDNLRNLKNVRDVKFKDARLYKRAMSFFNIKGIPSWLKSEAAAESFMAEKTWLYKNELLKFYNRIKISDENLPVWEYLTKDKSERRMKEVLSKTNFETTIADFRKNYNKTQVGILRKDENYLKELGFMSFDDNNLKDLSYVKMMDENATNPDLYTFAHNVFSKNNKSSFVNPAFGNFLARGISGDTPIFGPNGTKIGTIVDRRPNIYEAISYVEKIEMPEYDEGRKMGEFYSNALNAENFAKYIDAYINKITNNKFINLELGSEEYIKKLEELKVENPELDLVYSDYLEVERQKKARAEYRKENERVLSIHSNGVSLEDALLGDCISEDDEVNKAHVIKEYGFKKEDVDAYFNLHLYGVQAETVIKAYEEMKISRMHDELVQHEESIDEFTDEDIEDIRKSLPKADQDTYRSFDTAIFIDVMHKKITGEYTSETRRGIKYFDAYYEADIAKERVNKGTYERDCLTPDTDKITIEMDSQIPFC
jgi:hypothetical protein